MDKKFLKLYSKNKLSIWEKDVLKFPECINSNQYYSNRYNNFLYNTDYSDIHSVRYFSKNENTDLWYFNKYKSININNVSYLPFDTKHYVSQEIIGNSVYSTNKNSRRLFYTKYKIKNKELENILRNDNKYKYIIDKYGKNNILEFKLYNNDVYLVNVFNNDGPMFFDDIKKIGEYFDIKVPKEINSLIFKQGMRTLDIFTNTYYYEYDNYIKDRSYYITFFFKNNIYLMYKLN